MDVSSNNRTALVKPFDLICQISLHTTGIMNFPRASLVLAVTVVLCACATLLQAEKLNWREVPDVQQYLQNNPRARRMTQGPIGGIIDVIIDIIQFLIDVIFDRGPGQLSLGDQMKSLRGDMDQMKTLLGMG